MANLKVRILRQDSPAAAPRWEAFSLPYRKGLNVISLLREIRKTPRTAEGQPTTPVSWDDNCLENVCGSCTMLVNGRVQQACTALVDQLDKPIELRPMTKFPVIRDLVVDRQRMFEDLKRVRAWIEIDGTHYIGAGPRVGEQIQQQRYVMSTCMTCGCCLEVCPQINSRSRFIGAAAINQVRLFNQHPSGAFQADQRLEALMGKGGIQDCGNAQNCVKACPKHIPLVTSIAEVQRQTLKHSFKLLLRS